MSVTYCERIQNIAEVSKNCMQNRMLLPHPLYQKTLLCLYHRHLCRGVYSFRLSVRSFVCSFVRLFVCSVVHLFVRSFVLPSLSWNYFKVLRSSNSNGVYLTNHSSESIHIWTIGTLEGRLSFHDSSPQGPCPGVGLEVKT